ncbi:alpha/beta hydrolase [Paenibacillus cymbidii]|uniref:alpha/beta hydrolase n=1 Tax=Paenibacillus cymbidii TaxID=1639034 RepID=UPI0010821917|nr:alpha/beta hydrolase [Paenibacillus cymbidii]
MAETAFGHETIIYKEIDGRRLRLLVSRPEGWSDGDDRAAVVFIHGGGWQGGQPEMFLRHSRMFAARGAVAFSVEYRLIPRQHQEPPASGMAQDVETCIADCRSAMRYIRRHARELGVDPQRIAAVGDSAGGHLAASLATIDDYDSPGDDLSVSATANAVVNCNGIVDFTGRWKKFVPEADAEGGDAVRAWLARHEHAKALSPLYRIRAGQPPMLLMHGLRDEVVVPEDAERFYEAYTAAGNEAQLVLYGHLAHAFVLFDYTAAERDVLQAVAGIDAFLTERGFLPPQG